MQVGIFSSYFWKRYLMSLKKKEKKLIRNRFPTLKIQQFSSETMRMYKYMLVLSLTNASDRNRSCAIFLFYETNFHLRELYSSISRSLYFKSFLQLLFSIITLNPWLCKHKKKLIANSLMILMYLNASWM